MYPTQMRRQKIVRILLILFIVNHIANFVVGAPVAAQEKLDGPIDVDGTEDWKAALQKQMDEGSKNIPGQTFPSLDNLKTEALPSKNLHWSSKGSTDSNLLPRMPPSSSPPTTPPTPPPPSSPTPQPPASLYDRLPPPRTLPPYHPVPHLPLYSYGYGSPPPYRLVRPSDFAPFVARPFRPSDFVPSARPLRPSDFDPPSRPPIPYSHLPPAFSPPPPASSLITDNPWTTGHQPTPKQDSGPDLGVQPPPNPVPHPSEAAEIPIDKFSDLLKKAKLRRTLPNLVQ